MRADFGQGAPIHPREQIELLTLYCRIAGGMLEKANRRILGRETPVPERSTMMNRRQESRGPIVHSAVRERRANRNVAG